MRYYYNYIFKVSVKNQDKWHCHCSWSYNFPEATSETVNTLFIQKAIHYIMAIFFFLYIYISWHDCTLYRYEVDDGCYPGLVFIFLKNCIKCRPVQLKYSSLIPLLFSYMLFLLFQTRLGLIIIIGLVSRLNIVIHQLLFYTFALNCYYNKYL